MRGGSWWESTTPASPTDGYASARFYGHLPPPDVTARWDVTAIKPGPKCSLFAPESSPQVPSARLGCRPADLGVYTAVTACYSPGGGTSVYNLKVVYAGSLSSGACSSAPLVLASGLPTKWGNKSRTCPPFRGGIWSCPIMQRGRGELTFGPNRAHGGYIMP